MKISLMIIRYLSFLSAAVIKPKSPHTFHLNCAGYFI